MIYLYVGVILICVNHSLVGVQEKPQFVELEAKDGLEFKFDVPDYKKDYEAELGNRTESVMEVDEKDEAEKPDKASDMQKTG